MGWMSKEQKKQCVLYLENLVCSRRLSNKSNGLLIRAFHMSSPLVILMILCIGSHVFIYIILLFLTISAISFFIFNGCIISMLETRLCQDDFNVMDPFLEYMSMEKTNANRLGITYKIMFIYAILILCILFFRFYF